MHQIIKNKGLTGSIRCGNNKTNFILRGEMSHCVSIYGFVVKKVCVSLGKHKTVVVGVNSPTPRSQHIWGIITNVTITYFNN